VPGTNIGVIRARGLWKRNTCPWDGQSISQLSVTSWSSQILWGWHAIGRWCPSHPIFQQVIHGLSLEDYPHAIVCPRINHVPLSSHHWLGSCLQGLWWKRPQMTSVGQD